MAIPRSLKIVTIGIPYIIGLIFKKTLGTLLMLTLGVVSQAASITVDLNARTPDLYRYAPLTSTV